MPLSGGHSSWRAPHARYSRPCKQLAGDSMSALAGRIWASLAGAALLAAGSASASSGGEPGSSKPANDLNGVTVTAPRKPDPLADPTTQFVRQHLPASTFSEQYPRFRDEVCVKVVGLPDEFDAFVARRIIEVATKVGAPVSKADDCRPNIDVIFSTEPQALISDIAKRKDILLGFYWNSRDLKKLATFSRPVGAWYVTRTRSDSGESRLEIHDPADYTNPRVGRAGSRLSNGMSTEVVHSLILADANKVAGEKVDAVADYMAVLALARWQGLERCNAVPTILNLLADGCEGEPPEAMTRSDLALLTGLYSVDPRESGAQQRATIASAIRRAGDAAGKSGR